MTIPLPKKGTSPGSNAALAQDGFGGGEVPPHRTPILLVDDDKRNLLALSEVLADLGDVVCANSGAEALRWLLKRQFAVIILDVLMPELDGYETARLIRSREQSGDTPIIFLTAINKEDAHLLKGYYNGAVDYVFKPVEPLIIRSKVSVFASLYEKTQEIARKAAEQQKLHEERLEAQLERTRTLEELRASREREALLLRSLPLAFYIREPGDKGTRRFVAGNTMAITGFEPEAFERDPQLWRQRIHPEDLARAEPADAADEHTSEYRWRHTNGEYRHLLDQSVRLADADGASAGTVRDVTDQHLLQAQLQLSQKMDALGKLTGGIAHDFNNLLASVLSGLSLIERRGTLDDRSREIIQMTRHAVGQGKHLIDRMLSFSRRKSLAPEPTDLAETCRVLDGLLAPTLGGLIALKWDVASDLWPVFVDRAQLEMAVMNLVINARDAMPGGGAVTIRVRNENVVIPTADLAPGDYAMIEVADTGEGIPPEILSKVVEPFFTTKDTGKGTGLGLSTAYGFARQSGGCLRIDSTVGVGTRVRIWLPRAHHMPLATSVPEAAPAVPDVPMGQFSVLLVDDSPSLRDFTAEQLQSAGFRVTVAVDGAQAVRLLEETAFDVIITDYAMPGTSGLDVIRFARTKRTSYPAVIVTGYADAAVTAEGPKDVPIIMKPFTSEALIQAIGSVMDNWTSVSGCEQ